MQTVFSIIRLIFFTNSIWLSKADLEKQIEVEIGTMVSNQMPKELLRILFDKRQDIFA